MLNGTIIVFSGILSRIVLKVRLSMLKWFGIMLVITGLGLVGVTDILFGGDSTGWLWKSFC